MFRLLAKLSGPPFGFLLGAPVLSVLLACGNSRSAGAPGGPWVAVQDTTEDGITVRTLSGSVWRDSAYLIPEVEIGLMEGGEEYLIGEPRSLAVNDSGTIFLLDLYGPVVRSYDSQGTFIRNIGRSGSGPGEYESPDGMAVLPDGRILVKDPPNGRITVFDGDGAVLDEWPLTGGFNTDIRFYVDHQGQSYAATILEREVNPWDWTFGLVKYNLHGEVLDTVPAPTWDYRRPQVTASDGQSSTFRWVPFHPIPVWTFSPLGYMVGGLPTEYRMKLFRTDGPPLRIERTFEAIPVREAEAEEQRRNITRRLRRRFPGWTWNGPPIPAAKPPFKGLFASWEGDIWVVLSTEGIPTMTVAEAREEEVAAGTRPLRFREPVTLEVFSADGRFLGPVRVPESFRLEPEPVVRGDHVWAVTRDEMEVPRVVRFRIQHPG